MCAHQNSQDCLFTINEEAVIYKTLFKIQKYSLQKNKKKQAGKFLKVILQNRITFSLRMYRLEGIFAFFCLKFDCRFTLSKKMLWLASSDSVVCWG